jgi:hypothetical protein
VSLIERRTIPEKARPHYVRLVATLLRQPRPGSLSELTGDEMTAYVRRIWSQGKRADWQFRQCVDPIQLGLVDVAGVSAAQQAACARRWGRGAARRSDLHQRGGGFPILASQHPLLVIAFSGQAIRAEPKERYNALAMAIGADGLGLLPGAHHVDIDAAARRRVQATHAQTSPIRPRPRAISAASDSAHNVYPSA